MEMESYPKQSNNREEKKLRYTCLLDTVHYWNAKNTATICALY